MDENPEHPVGAICFSDIQLQVASYFDTGQWLVDITTWAREGDPNDPPETTWGLLPTHARQLADMLIEAAEACELFHSA
jgi:hypothetical protein